MTREEELRETLKQQLLRDYEHLLRDNQQLRDTLGQIEKHIDTRLDTVGDLLRKEIETYTNPPHQNVRKRQRSVRVQNALKADKQSMQHIRAIVRRALEGENA